MSGHQLAMTELGFPVEMMEALEAEGRWPDLSRMRVRAPEKLKALVVLLGFQVPVRLICERLGVSASTVQAVLDDPELGPSVVTQREGVESLARLALRMGLEDLVEELRAGAKKLPVFDLKLLFEIVQLAQGGATVRVEHVVRAEMSEAETQVMRLLEAREVRVSEIGSLSAAVPVKALGMGLEGEKMGEVGAGAERAGDLVVTGAGDGSAA